MKLQELMEKPVDYKWGNTSGGYQYAGFKIGDETYDVNFFIKYRDELGDKAGTIEFISNKGGFGVTNSGNGLKVFSTVFQIIKDFVRKNDLKFLAFSAKEPSRRKLYKHFIKRYAKRLGYELGHVGDIQGEEAYYLVRT